MFSLASSGVYKIRSRILQLLLFIGRWKCSSRSLTDEVIFRVFLGFTGDIYPILRRDAIDGLFEFLTVAGAGVDIGVADCCLDRALGLMGDDDELVRSAAVRMVIYMFYTYWFYYLVKYLIYRPSDITTLTFENLIRRSVCVGNFL